MAYNDAKAADQVLAGGKPGAGAGGDDGPVLANLKPKGLTDKEWSLVLIVAGIGTVLEYFDFYCYTQLSAVLGKVRGPARARARARLRPCAPMPPCLARAGGGHTAARAAAAAPRPAPRPRAPPPPPGPTPHASPQVFFPAGDKLVSALSYWG
jgi:hypothetical protein